MLRKIIFEKGQQIGLWTILGEATKDSNRNRLYEVQCKCGKISKVRASDLKRGKTKGCHSCSRRRHKKQNS